MNKKTPLMITFIMICASLLAQNQSASTDRDKLKKQERKAEINAMIKNTMDTAFTDNKVPAKWNGENLVVLSKFRSFKVKKRGNKLHTLTIFRQRVKIQSKSALNDYSEYSFKNDFDSKNIFYRVKANYYLDFKIIKRNGEIVNVDVNEAVEKSINRGEEKVGYKKIAIPNLEIGDILDYYIAVETLFPKGSFHAFDPEFSTLITKHPIKKQIIHFDLGKDIYLNAKSVNGAPELQSINTSEKTVEYVLVDTMRDKIVDDIHFNYATSLPHLKYQAYYSQSTLKPSPNLKFYSYMMGDREKIKNTIDVNNLKPMTSILAKRFFFSTAKDRFAQYISLTHQHLKDNHKKKEANKIELAQDAYYYLREYCFRNNLDRYLFEGKYRPMGYLGVLHRSNAIHVLAAVLQRWDVSFNMVYTIPSHYSKIENWIFIDEVRPLLEITNNKDTLYISDFHNNSNPGFLNVNIAGNDAYRVPIEGFSLGNAKLVDNVVKCKLPKQNLADNTGSMKVNLKIDDFKKDVEVQFDYNLSGNTQIGWDTALVNPIKSYEQVKSKYQHTTYSPHGISSNTKKLYEKNYEELKTKAYKENKKSARNIFRMKTGIDDFEIDTLVLENTGRWCENDTMSFNITSTLSHLIDDVGDGFILNLGSLIARSPIPTELPDSVDYSFQISGPTSFTNLVDITLPSGYTIDEFSKIDTIASNSIGYFHIKTSTKRDKYFIEIKEELYKHFAKPKKWSEYHQIYNLAEDLVNTQLFIRGKE